MPYTLEELLSLPVLLDVGTVAALFDVSERYVRALCARGKLKARKVGKGWRINRDSALQFAGLL